MNALKSLFALGFLAATLACNADPIIKDGQKLAFLGDSITQQGADHSGGYAKLVISGLEANGIKAAPVFTGIGGNKSNDMLGRLDRDVISKKPDFMTLSCGVNDVWHGVKGVPLDQYKENISAILDKAKAANVKVVVLTATMIGEDPAAENNKKLEPYNEFLRATAKEKGLPLADLNKQMQEAVAKAKAANAPKPNAKNFLTSDGVHMAPPGDMMMAEGVLRALGLDDAQVAKAKAAWLKIPASSKVQATAMVSLEEYAKLMDAAAKANQPLDAYVGAIISKSIADSLAK